MSDCNSIRVSDEASDSSNAGPIAQSGASPLFDLAVGLARAQARHLQLMSGFYWMGKQTGGMTDDGQYADRDLQLARAERKDWVCD